MKARVLALGLVLAWPSFAHAGWFGDTIGRPITGGLGLGVHEFKGAMKTGAQQTKGAFAGAAQGAGLTHPPSDAKPASPPATPDGKAPAETRPAAKAG